METSSSRFEARDELIRTIRTFASNEDALERTWLDLACRLLRLCRQNQPSPDKWELLGGEPDVTITAAYTSVRAALVAVLAEHDELGTGDGLADPADEYTSRLSFASDAQIDAFASAVEAELDRAGDAWHAAGGDDDFLALAVARGAADAVDSLFGHTFIQPFRDEGEVRLVPGEPYPVVPHNPAGYVDEFGPNTNPANLPSRDLAHTRRLRMAISAESSLQYVLAFEHWNLLAPLRDADHLVLAVGQPNLSLAEFDIDRDEETNLYFNNGPKDSEAQAATVLEVIEAAGQRDVDILVLPEYTLDWHARHLIEVGLDELSARPQVVVAGFVEHSGPDKFVEDRAWLGVLGRPPMPAKSATLARKTSNAPVDGVSEGIRLGSEVRFLVTREWTLAIPICLDALSLEMWQRAAAVGANLVLIPAMSAKTTSMLQAAGSMRASSQAFIALSNGPAHWVQSAEAIPDGRGGAVAPLRVEGAFGGPYGHADADWTLLPAREGVAGTETYPEPEPLDVGLWIFDSSTREVEWVSIKRAQ